jgi:hypothetical protein
MAKVQTVRWSLFGVLWQQAIILQDEQTFSAAHSISEQIILLQVVTVEERAVQERRDQVDLLTQRRSALGIRESSARAGESNATVSHVRRAEASSGRILQHGHALLCGIACSTGAYVLFLILTQKIRHD